MSATKSYWFVVCKSGGVLRNWVQQISSDVLRKMQAHQELYPTFLNIGHLHSDLPANFGRVIDLQIVDHPSDGEIYLLAKIAIIQPLEDIFRRREWNHFSIETAKDEVKNKDILMGIAVTNYPSSMGLPANCDVIESAEFQQAAEKRSSALMNLIPSFLTPAHKALKTFGGSTSLPREKSQAHNGLASNQPFRTEAEQQEANTLISQLSADQPQTNPLVQQTLNQPPPENNSQPPPEVQAVLSSESQQQLQASIQAAIQSSVKEILPALLKNSFEELNAQKETALKEIEQGRENIRKEMAATAVPSTQLTPSYLPPRVSSL